MEESVKTEQVNAYQYSPLALAYMGDSILDLLVKKYFVTHSNMQPHKYHVEVSKIVKAVNQADISIRSWKNCQRMSWMSTSVAEIRILIPRRRMPRWDSTAKQRIRSPVWISVSERDMERLQYFVNGMIKQYLAGKEQ